MTAIQIVSRSDFVAADMGGDAANLGLTKEFTATIKAADDKARTIDFIISTASPDRMGDTISVNGWRTESYMRNPVVLWAHNSSMPPIARAMHITKSPSALLSRAEFMSRDISPFADSIYQMYKEHFLSAVSVGFLPLKYAHRGDTGIAFSEQELLEWSCCSVPANADCLAQARAAGIDIAPIMDGLRQVRRSLRSVERTAAGDDAIARSWRYADR